MTNFLQDSANALRKSSGIIPIFLVFLALFVIGCSLGWEDFSTNVAGYTLLPTLKVNDWVKYCVALFPQIGSIAFLLVFMMNTNKRWGALASMSLFLVDIAFDMWFKTNGFTAGFGVGVIAFIESVVIYTLGSEVAIAVSFGILIELAPDFFDKMLDLASGAFKFLINADKNK